MQVTILQVADVQAKQVGEEVEVGQRRPFLALLDTQQQHTNVDCGVSCRQKTFRIDFLKVPRRIQATRIKTLL